MQDQTTLRLNLISYALLLPACLCSPGCQNGGSISSATPTDRGLRYYVPKDVVVVSATVTESVGGEVEVENEEFVVKPKYELTATEASVDLKTVPDTASEPHFLDLKPSGSKNQTLALGVSEDGLLTSVNLQTTDRTGEVVNNVTKFVSGIAGIALGFLGPADKAAAQKVFDKTKEGAALKAGGDATEDRYEAELARFRELPIRVIYLLNKSPTALATWDRLVDLDKGIAAKQVQRATLLDQMAKAGKKEEIELATQQLGGVRESLGSLITERAAEQAAFDAALSRFVSDEKLGTTSHTRRVFATLELSDLPEPGVLKDKKKVEEVRGALARHKAALDLFDRARIVVTLSPNPARRATAAAPVMAVETAGAKASSASTRGQSEVFYREPVPATVDVYALGLVVDEQKIPGNPSVFKADRVVRQVEQKQVSVMTTDLEPRRFVYEPKLFSDQNLSLTFSNRGRLTGTTQSATAFVANATAAAAGALTTGQEQFVKGLQTVQTVQSTRQAMNLAELSNRVDLVKKRKELIDARVALGGAAADAELVAEQRRLTEELAVLQAQQNLTKFRDADDLAVDQAKLQAQVNLLEQQLQLIKKQRELDELNKPATTSP